MEVWIGRDGERHGPYPESDIRRWLRSGEVSRDDLGWYEGLADWQPLAVLFPDSAPATGPAVEPPPLATPASALPETRSAYASFGQRLRAWLLDLLILTVPNMVVFYALGGLEAYRHLMAQMQSGVDMAALQQYVVATRPEAILSVVIGFVYYCLFEASRWQATPGKLALKLRVVDTQGQRLSIGRSAVRNVVRLANLVIWIVPFVCYLAVAWTQRRQGLHDLLAGTLVLNGRAGEATSAERADRPGSFSA